MIRALHMATGVALRRVDKPDDGFMLRGAEAGAYDFACAILYDLEHGLLNSVWDFEGGFYV